MSDDMIAEINMRNALRRKGEDLRKIACTVYNRPGANTLAHALRKRIAKRRKQRESAEHPA
jgi:hypothetical protein